MKRIFIEAEGFRDLGGWVIDQQSTLQIGSPYIMAHGLGEPVSDAVTDFDSESGDYTVYVRTRDWTAPFGELKAGRFTAAVDGITLPEVLGSEGAEWHWQNAGKMHLDAGRHTLTLHDLTGFDGRCDAVYLTAEGDVPPNGEELASFRRLLVAPVTEVCETVYDLAVIGGGIAGVCTALAAARSGVSVLLVHDREVLGGCNSSEVRVCLGGMLHLPPYDKLGNTVKEIQPIMGDPSTFKKEFFEDDRKRFAFMLKECKIKCDIALGEMLIGAVTEGGVIREIETLHIKSGVHKKYRATIFSDCTGDAVLSRMAGASVMYGREAKTEFNESLGANEHEHLVMGQSIRWYSEEQNEPCGFPNFDSGLFTSDEDCLHILHGDWEQETGFRRNMADETEYIRDYGLYMIYGNWSFQKNRSASKDKYAKSKMIWASHLGGKRESYRVVGDLILNQNHIENREIFDDATACMTWSIDLHFPECTNEERFGEAFRSFAYHRGIVEAYPIPYRCLYARDVKNLFLGGRTVSASHVAFSSLRVMRTLGMLGEVVGLAASVCKKNGCTPREVYTDHLCELKELMQRGVPSPNSFECALGREEAFHFKDAGWFFHDKPEKLRESPYREKVMKNIKKLGLTYKYENTPFEKD